MEKNKACGTPEPNFAQFDDLSQEKRVQARKAAAEDLIRQRRRKWMICSLAVGWSLTVIMAVTLWVFLK